MDSECRVQVGEFPDHEKAFQLAELVALELGIEADARWSGWIVEVRNLQGQGLFATTVGGDPHSFSAPGQGGPLAEDPLTWDRRALAG